MEPIRRIRVIVADDSTRALRSVCSYLQLEGVFDVVSATIDGMHLLREVHRLLPELVLVDLSMPRINGLEVTRQLRRSFPELRIIIFTELSGLSLKDECLRSGADGFIYKDELPEKLMPEVRSLFPELPNS